MGGENGVICEVGSAGGYLKNPPLPHVILRLPLRDMVTVRVFVCSIYRDHSVVEKLALCYQPGSIIL